MEKYILYTKLLKQQISTFQKEKRFLEFKSNYQNAEKLGKYISALSNGACLDNQDFGYLYFGVDNDTLEVKYTTFDCSKVNAAECQEWIIRTLKEHDFLSRAQINELLWNKLPSDFDDRRKNAKIGNLLTKMRKAGIITTAEKKRWKMTDEFKRTSSEFK